jgi:S1-C subfamily serine protease
VSNLGRKAGPTYESGDPRGDKNTLHHFGTLIQTDARLNLGTSGGALINLQGDMIGLTTSTAALAGYEQSAGYAIPINAAVKRVIDTLKMGREVEYGFLGIQPGDLNEAERSQLRLDSGARVKGMVAGSPAQAAGVQREDIILAIDGTPIRDTDDLMLAAGQQPSGQRVSVSVLRGGQRRDLTVALGKYPVRGKIIAHEYRWPLWRGIRVDYTTSRQDLLPTTNDPASLPEEPGSISEHIRSALTQGCVVVDAIEQGSPAEKARITANTLITHVAGKRVRTPEDFYEAVKNLTGPVEIRVAEGDQSPRTISPQ